jgi:hypothetical protein
MGIMDSKHYFIAWMLSVSTFICIMGHWRNGIMQNASSLEIMFIGYAGSHPVHSTEKIIALIHIWCVCDVRWVIELWLTIGILDLVVNVLKLEDPLQYSGL